MVMSCHYLQRTKKILEGESEKDDGEKGKEIKEDQGLAEEKREERIEGGILVLRKKNHHH